MHWLTALHCILKRICNFLSLLKNTLKFTKNAESEKMNIVKWSTMLPEIMEMISDRLPVKDFLSFRSVCKTWHSLPSNRSHISKFFKDKLWLLFYESQEDKCYLYSSTHSKPCSFYLPDLKGATIMHSKYGWLIAHRNEHFFLYNFFTRTKINLPDHAVSENQAYTFTTLPIQKDCTVFIFARKSDLHVEVSSCHVNDKKWKVELLDIKRSMINVLDVVLCCCCGPNGKGCNCSLQNMFFFVSKDHKWARYDYMRNHIVCNSDSFTYVNYYATEWKNDIEALHKNDWIQRFGSEKGAVVRFGSLIYQIGWIHGLQSSERYYSANSESDRKYNFVKAAIVETKYLKIEDVSERRFGWF